MKRYQDKLLMQTVVCLAIFGLIRLSSVIGGGMSNEIKGRITEYAKTDYSIEEIQEIVGKLAEKAANAPETLVSAIIEANEADEFTAPINEKGKEDIKTVHAAGDGIIIYAGIDKNLGMCVKLQHKDKVSVYGNLYTLTAVTGEQVKKGDIIGTFDSKSGKEFYYQLE